jgi:hypothetical protein
MPRSSGQFVLIALKGTMDPIGGEVTTHRYCKLVATLTLNVNTVDCRPQWVDFWHWDCPARTLR